MWNVIIHSLITNLYLSQVLADTSSIARDLSCSEYEVQQMLSILLSTLRGWCLQLKSKDEFLTFDPDSGHAWRMPKGMVGKMDCEGVVHCCCGYKFMPSDCLEQMGMVFDSEDLNAHTIPFITDSGTRHCVKDAVGYDFVVLDSYSAVVNALNKASLTASMLMSVGQFVMDKN